LGLQEPSRKGIFGTRPGSNALKYCLIVALAAASLTTLTMPAHAADVGVSISVGQPGFYGQIDIGDFPQPQLIYGYR